MMGLRFGVTREWIGDPLLGPDSRADVGLLPTKLCHLLGFTFSSPTDCHASTGDGELIGADTRVECKLSRIY